MHIYDTLQDLIELTTPPMRDWYQYRLYNGLVMAEYSLPLKQPLRATV